MKKILKDKKGAGLSFNVLILLIIGLIVIVIVGAILFGKIKFFEGNLNECTSKKGECKTQAECLAGGETPFFGGCGDGLVCCIGSGWDTNLEES